MSLLLPAYAVRREGTVFTGVCLSIGEGVGRGRGGYPPSPAQDRGILPLPPTLPSQDTGTLPPPFAAGGMPLAFTHEDFLVYICVRPKNRDTYCSSVLFLLHCYIHNDWNAP